MPIAILLLEQMFERVFEASALHGRPAADAPHRVRTDRRERKPQHCRHGEVLLFRVMEELILTSQNIAGTRKFVKSTRGGGHGGQLLSHRGLRNLRTSCVAL